MELLEKRITNLLTIKSIVTIRSDGAGDEEYSEKQEIILPLTFDDWDAHEDFYMAILKEDAKALERYDAGEGEEE